MKKPDDVDAGRMGRTHLRQGGARSKDCRRRFSSRGGRDWSDHRRSAARLCLRPRHPKHRAGAQILTGGRYGALFCRPTVLVDRSVDIVAYRHEVFGPLGVNPVVQRRRRHDSSCRGFRVWTRARNLRTALVQMPQICMPSTDIGASEEVQGGMSQSVGQSTSQIGGVTRPVEQSTSEKPLDPVAR